HYEAIMTVQFSRQAMAALSGNLAKTGSGLVRRLVRARNDPGKERIRKWLIDLDDASTAIGPRPHAGRHCRPARWYVANLPDGDLSPRTAGAGYRSAADEERLTESANEAQPHLGKAPQRDIRYRLKITEGT